MHKFLFSFTCTTGASGISVGGYCLGYGKHPMFPQGGGYPLYDSVTSVSGHQPRGRMYQAMSLLGCVPFWVPLSCSQKLPAAMLCLRCPACLYQASQQWVREECRGDARSHVCGSVLSNGFSNNQDRSLRMESCLCSFEICRVRILLLGGPQENGGMVSMSVAFFVWWWWFVECCHTTCTPSLALALGSISLCTGYPGSGVSSASLVCPVGVAPCPFTVMSTRLCLWIPFSFLLLFHLLCSPWFTHLQMSQCE